MSTKKYSVSYKVAQGEFTKKQLNAAELGGCDNIIIHSIILPEDGSYSHLLISCNGKGAGMNSNDIFKAWVSMAHTLMEKEDLSPNKRELCKTIFEIVRDSIMKNRN